jgi:hypothetical protein
MARHLFKKKTVESIPKKRRKKKLFLTLVFRLVKKDRKKVFKKTNLKKLIAAGFEPTATLKSIVQT